MDKTEILKLVFCDDFFPKGCQLAEHMSDLDRKGLAGLYGESTLPSVEMSLDDWFAGTVQGVEPFCGQIRDILCRGCNCRDCRHHLPRQMKDRRRSSGVGVSGALSRRITDQRRREDREAEAKEIIKRTIEAIFTELFSLGVEVGSCRPQNASAKNAALLFEFSVPTVKLDVLVYLTNPSVSVYRYDDVDGQKQLTCHSEKILSSSSIHTVAELAAILLAEITDSLRQ